MNIQLLRSADFNQKLRGREIPVPVTVQMTCRYAKDENEVRRLLDQIWDSPAKSDEILKKLAWTNKDIYDFEKILELTPTHKTVLDYYRAHKDDFDAEKCAEELGLSIKQVHEAMRVLKKKGLV
jgi:predicted Rossmann fold nucleotide-binding protein DprA/Smf involved in DNA uptake